MAKHNKMTNGGNLGFEAKLFKAAELIDLISSITLNETSEKLAVRGIDSDIRWNNKGSFHKDELRDLKADVIKELGYGL